jgi:hypothetical protein
LFNASFGIYDPYHDKLEAIEFPGITHNTAEHIGGVGWDKYSGLVSVLVDAAAAFTVFPFGSDVSGTNLIKKYDPVAKKFLWTVNLTEITQGVYGGFNDMTTDPRGNTYIVGTFPGTVIRVDKDGKEAIPWYLPATINTTDEGFGGIAGVGDTLISMDAGKGQLFRFDARDDHGTPVLVPHTPNTAIVDSDGIHLPIKFDGKVLLVAEHENGVTVMRSNDGWRTAQHLGSIPNPPGLAPGVLVVSTVQIGDSLYIINDWFTDPVVPGTTAGNKTSFPMIDITADVDRLLAKGHH